MGLDRLPLSAKDIVAGAGAATGTGARTTIFRSSPVPKSS